MPKIQGELEKIVREMALSGYNPTAIGKRVGVAKETVILWAKRNNVPLVKRITPERAEKKRRFIELIKAGKTIKQAKDEVGYKGGIVTKEYKEANDLLPYIRSRAQAAKEDKTLTLEEATSRLPPGSGRVIGFRNNSNGCGLKYIVQAEDGYVYYKSSGRLHQGDPRGKCGTFLTLEDVKARLREAGYEYVSGFTTVHIPIEAIHLKCNRIRRTILAMFPIQDCPTCSNTGVSKEEIEVRDWVESLGFKTTKYKMPNRITRPQEIDIDILDTPISIEYCGWFFHGDKPRNYHYDKMIAERARGKQLLTILDIEWRNRKEQIKGFITSLLQKNTSIYARKCLVERVFDKELVDSFLDYHIQGKVRYLLAYGLFYLGELIGVMTFSQHHRKTKRTATLVLNRLCFKPGITVVGGASKLLRFAKGEIVDLGYTTIITWSDNRWSSGSVYPKMGFVLDTELRPDYFYLKDGQIFSKQSQRKTPEDRATGLTERELKENQGFIRFWDCGKKRWLMDLA